MRFVTAFSLLLLWGTSLAASEKAEKLARALHLDQVMEILRYESQQQRVELDETLLDNKGGAFFQAQLDDIYDPVWMQSQITTAFEQKLTDSQLDHAILFFESDLGRTIVSLENSARRAIVDETIEQMARETYESGPRDTTFFRLVDEYIQVNDLVEQNVQGSLSADFSFFRGLDLEAGMDDSELLAELLSQKDTKTAETRIWLYSFLLMAYRPLDEAQLRENIAFSRTDAGRALNAALFSGFDQMFDTISFQMGRTVAQVLDGSDL